MNMVTCIVPPTRLRSSAQPMPTASRFRSLSRVFVGMVVLCTVQNLISVRYVRRLTEESYYPPSRLLEIKQFSTSTSELSTGILDDPWIANPAKSEVSTRGSYDTTETAARAIRPPFSNDNGTAFPTTTPLFIVLSTPRSGADWLMHTLNRNPFICSSGDYPMGLLSPHPPDAWVSNPQCTWNALLERVSELTADQPLHESSASATPSSRLPAQCQNISDTILQLGNGGTMTDGSRLGWVCEYVRQLHGNYSVASILDLYLRNFAEHTAESNLLPCTCPASSLVRGMRIHTADWIQNQPPIHHTSMVGRAKVIRLTRKNYWDHYMSTIVPYETNYWAVNNAQEKAEQMHKFRDLNYTINIDNMLASFERMKDADEHNDKLAQLYSGGDERILWMDMENFRNEPRIALSQISTFLGIPHPDDGLEMLVNLHKPGTFASYSGRNLLSYISNADGVEEALAANGYGSFINSTAYQPIHHVVYSTSHALLMETTRDGLEVTIVTPESTSQQYLGPSSRFTASLPYLQSIPPDAIVVLSEEYNGSFNPHIRGKSAFYDQLSQFRRTVVNQPFGAVVVSATNTCCSSALSHVELGSLFGSDGRRHHRTCYGAECEQMPKESGKLQRWLTFMKDQALNVSESKSIYLDGTLVAGKASDLIGLIEALDLAPMEDDRAVLIDYMYHNPGKIVLDYDPALFGKRFDGVTSKMDVLCVGSNSANVVATTNWVVSTTTPLMVHSTREHQSCHQPSRTSTEYFTSGWTGIELQPILHHIDRVMIQNISATGIHRHFGKEIFYVIDKTGVWATEVIRDPYRGPPIERFLGWAHERLMNPIDNTARRRWRYLYKAIETSGLPFWAWTGDWKDCHLNNVGNKNETVPIFTMSGVTRCKQNFAMPSYFLIGDAKSDTAHKDEMILRSEQQYPWESKIQKVVWRGELSEGDISAVFHSQRWRLCKMIHEESDSRVRDMFDVGLTGIPWFLKFQMSINVSEVGGTLPKIGNSMADFQKYRAILDMDGNSWSSRFPALLCSNSVSVKVEPAYVDYFFMDLVPWKHYVPVKNDLSDLVDNVAFVLDPANDVIVREIVASANQWCTERTTSKALVSDMLDIWEEYVQYLTEADPNWQDKWSAKKNDLFSPNSYIPLVKLK